MTERTYQLSTCPCFVVEENEVVLCGAELSVQIDVHADGAEYGVWASTVNDGRITCGHSLDRIANDEQLRLLGIEP